MSRHSLPAGATRSATVAERLQISNGAQGDHVGSAIPLLGPTAENFSAVATATCEATSRRNVAFLVLRLDQRQLGALCGAYSLIGMPGNPGPEPTSAIVAGVAPSAKQCAGGEQRFTEMASHDLFWVSRTAVRLTRAFHRSSTFEIEPQLVREIRPQVSPPRKGCSRSAMRVLSIDNIIQHRTRRYERGGEMQGLCQDTTG